MTTVREFEREVEKHKQELQRLRKEIELGKMATLRESLREFEREVEKHKQELQRLRKEIDPEVVE